MKKLALIIILFGFMFLLSGCGQDLKVTVYNATGITSSYGWVAIDVTTEHYSAWFEPTGSALTDSDCGDTNSLSFTSKENDTLNIGGNGAYAVFDTPTTYYMQPFTLPNGSMTLYGGFLESPQWYAAVNMESVVIYKK